MNFETIFKIVFFLILLIAIYLSEKSRRIYRNLDFHEKELKLDLFAKRTNFLIFILIFLIIVLLVYKVIIGVYFEYVFLIFLSILIAFDVADSINKIDILKKNNFSFSFIDDFRLFTKYSTICYILMLILFLFRNNVL